MDQEVFHWSGGTLTPSCFFLHGLIYIIMIFFKCVPTITCDNCYCLSFSSAVDRHTLSTQLRHSHWPWEGMFAFPLILLVQYVVLLNVFNLLTIASWNSWIRGVTLCVDSCGHRQNTSTTWTKTQSWVQSY